MSAVFNGASYLLNSAPQILTFPFTVGLWVYPTLNGAVQTIWSLGNSGLTTNWFVIRHDGGGNWNTSVNDGASTITTFGACTLNQWHFLVFRCISATNRRATALQYNGTIAHTSSTTSRSPTTNNMTVGAGFRSDGINNPLTGSIGEFWCTNTDIQPDGLQLQDSLLRQLAYRGPLSLPNIAKDIIEYRSLRSRLDSREDTPDEVYYSGARPVWTNTNGVTLGPHPLAADNYIGPLGDNAPMVLV